PVWCVRCSVASPIRPARGSTARHDITKTQVGEACVQAREKLTGTKTRRRRRMLWPAKKARAPVASARGNARGPFGVDEGEALGASGVEGGAVLRGHGL